MQAVELRLHIGIGFERIALNNPTPTIAHKKRRGALVHKLFGYGVFIGGKAHKQDALVITVSSKFSKTGLQHFADGAVISGEFDEYLPPLISELAQAFIIGEKFIGDSPCALVLGDNIFYGHEFANLMAEADSKASGATVFAYHVHDPERYGVVSLGQQARR